MEGDAALWLGNLHHVVSIVRGSHEFSHCRPAEGMVGCLEVGHLVDDVLQPEVVRVAKRDVESKLLEWC